MLFDLLVEAAFDLEVLDDSFDDQVTVLQFRQVVIEITHGDQRRTVGSKEGGRL